MTQTTTVAPTRTGANDSLNCAADQACEEASILEKQESASSPKRFLIAWPWDPTRGGTKLPDAVASQLKWRALGLLSVAIFILAWHLLALYMRSPYLPTPAAVVAALMASLTEKDFLGYTIEQHTLASLLRIVYGFALAVVLAVPLGLATGWFRLLAALTDPIVEVMRPIPPLAWIPFAIYFFRPPTDAIFLVVLAAFFPIFLNTQAGVRAIHPVLVDAARTLGARRLRLFASVIVPAAIAPITTGARVGLGIAWMSIVAAEMVGVKGGGLGVFVWSMAEVGRFDAVFAGMVLIGLLGMLLTGAMSLVERRYGHREPSDA